MDSKQPDNTPEKQLPEEQLPEEQQAIPPTTQVVEEPVVTPTPNAKPSNCLNCQAPLPAQAAFCASCGQKCTDGKVTLGALLRDFFANVLNLDAKIWRTLWALLSPGKLTEAFFLGQQKSYIKPIRLFFVITVATIAIVSFFELDKADEFFLTVDEGFNQELSRSLFLEEYDSLASVLRSSIPTTDHYVLDSLNSKLSTLRKDSLDIGLRVSRESGKNEMKDFPIATLDLVRLPFDSLVVKYQVTGTVEKLLLRQNIRLQRKGEDIGKYMLSNMIWMLLVMMPILALVLKLFYVRRRRYYVEHLIFSFHVHTFVFLLLSLLLLAQNIDIISNISTGLGLASALVAEVYYILALKRVYQQSWRKTILKGLLLNVLYFFVSLLVLIFAAIIAALVF